MILPDRRLVRAVGVWTVASVLGVAVPALLVPLAAALGVLAALALWDAVALLRRPAPVLERRVPDHAYVGREAEVEVCVRNPAAVGVEAEVWDEVPADVACGDPHFPLVAVRPGEVETVRYRVCPAVRGDRPFGTAVAFVRGPTGLLRRRCTLAARQELRVYADVSRFMRPEALDPRRVFASMGVRPAPRRGDGMDFESLRDYVPGDDPRRLDWAATARRGRHVLRCYQHERNHTVMLALDASRLMGGVCDGRTKLDHAIDAALALAYAALAVSDRVGVVVFDREVRGHLAPRARRGDLGVLVDALRGVQPRLVEADYRALVRDLAARQRQRSLVVIFTDFVETDPGAIVEPLALLARRHRVLCVCVRDPAYAAVDPRPPGGDPLGLYRRLVVGDLLRERDGALSRLRRRGVQTLDLPPQAIRAPLLNRYLAIRYGPER